MPRLKDNPSPRTLQRRKSALKKVLVDGTKTFNTIFYTELIRAVIGAKSECPNGFDIDVRTVAEAVRTLARGERILPGEIRDVKMALSALEDS